MDPDATRPSDHVGAARADHGAAGVMTLPARPTVCVSLPVDDADGGGRRARHALADVLRQWDGLDADTRDTVELLGSELITNALAHAAPQRRGCRAIQMRVLLLHDRVRVDVDDPDPMTAVQPRPADAADLLAEHGRGLLAVDRLAMEWGVRRRPDGKTVWFTCALGAGASQRAAEEIVA